MQIRNIILGVVGLGVFLALLFLALEVGSSSEAEVDEAALERAKAMYERRQRRQRQAQPSFPSRNDRTRTRTRTAPSSRDEEEEPEPEPDPNEPVDRGGNTRVAPQVSIVGDSLEKGTRGLMKDVRKAYDQGNYPTAEELALEAVRRRPRHIKMLRYVVSTSCALGKADQARQYYRRLPSSDKRDMRARCSKWQVKFEDE